MNKPLVILGAGGHAKVLIDVLRLRSAELLGLVDADSGKHGQLLFELPVMGGDVQVRSYPVDTIRLVNGLGSVRVDPRRRRLFEQFRQEGYRFASVIHPSAIIASGTILEEGVQIMAGAVIQAGCHVGMNAILNTGAIVDHDCHIGSHAHVAPGAILSGGVLVGENTHIGTGATVIQNVRIGRNCLIAAGAVVVRDVPDDAIVAGIPAKEGFGEK